MIIHFQKLFFISLLQVFLISSILLLKVVLKLFFKKSHSLDAYKTLFVKTDAIGDFILWFSVYKDFMNNEDLLLVNKNNFEIAIFLGINKKNLILLEPNFKNPAKLFLFFKKLNNFEFLTSINACSGRSFWPSDALIFLSNSKYKIGSAYSGRDKKDFVIDIPNIIYDYIENAGTEPSDSVMLTHLAMFNHFREKTKTKENPSFFEAELALKPKKNQGLTISVIPGASKIFRQWGEKNFLSLILQLDKIMKFKEVNILGTMQEKDICDYIYDGSKCNNINAFNLAGRLSICEYITQIAKSDFIITNETSSAHIGPFMNTKTFIILGGGHFGKFSPLIGKSKNSFEIYNKMSCFNCNWECKFNKNDKRFVPCITSIELENVKQQILSHYK